MKIEQRGIGMTSQRARNRLADQLRAMGIQSERVLELIRTTPRHLFVDEALASRSYENTALPIGYGQTISQPYVVARMSEALAAGSPLKRVLEVGAGCGYQSAILAGLADKVFSVERIEALANRMRTRLYEVGTHNVRVLHGDGRAGWPEHAPYDAILVAAATATIPQAWIEQLAAGGRLILPVGQSEAQDLVLVTRTDDGIQRQTLERVTFVPLLIGTD